MVVVLWTLIKTALRGPMMHDVAKVEVVEDAAGVVLATLSALDFETMTDGGVEFVLCASALTAQM